jgi:hypothetical protein
LGLGITIFSHPNEKLSNRVEKDLPVHRLAGRIGVSDAIHGVHRFNLQGQFLLANRLLPILRIGLAAAKTEKKSGMIIVIYITIRNIVMDSVQSHAHQPI